MASKKNNLSLDSFDSFLGSFIDRCADAIVARASEGTGAGTAQRGSAKANAKPASGVRMCPAPGCDKPGAGPRNRWFCQDHARSLSKTQQIKLLAAARSEAKTAKRGGKASRTLDMRCRVAGCKNRSRGPRFGYICDMHRKSLSKKEQQAARLKWKETHAGRKAA